MTSLSPPASPPNEVGSRPRAFSALSNDSKRSRRSSGSGTKLDLTETSKDKKRLNTKADPSKALNEAQPADVAVDEESTLNYLRNVQWRDTEGNVIQDPDRSNPSRPRLERPLDTIRSFHAAADGTDAKRHSTYSPRPGSQISFGGMDRGRSSGYYTNVGYGSPQRSRLSGGYYRNGSYGFRPDSIVEDDQGRGQQYTNRPMRGPMAYNQQPGIQPVTPVQPGSYDAMTSGSDDNYKTTSPSSVNSSMDYIHPLGMEFPQDYANGFNSARPTMNGRGSQNHNQQNGDRVNNAPMAPPKDTPVNKPQVPIKLNGSARESDFSDGYEPSKPEKRQSWIKRRFSRRNS